MSLDDHRTKPASQRFLAPLHLRALVRRHEVWLVALAVSVGALAGLCVWLMTLTTRLAHKILFNIPGGGRLSGVEHIAWWRVLIIPALGGLVLGFIICADITCGARNLSIRLKRMRSMVGVCPCGIAASSRFRLFSPMVAGPLWSRSWFYTARRRIRLTDRGGLPCAEGRSAHSRRMWGRCGDRCGIQRPDGRLILCLRINSRQLLPRQCRAHRCRNAFRDRHDASLWL